MVIDAWAQHPTLRFSQDPIFDSLRRWTKAETPTEELPAHVAADEIGYPYVTERIHRDSLALPGSSTAESDWMSRVRRRQFGQNRAQSGIGAAAVADPYVARSVDRYGERSVEASAGDADERLRIAVGKFSHGAVARVGEPDVA